MSLARANGIPYMRRRLDKSTEAREWNKVRDGVETLYQSQAPDRPRIFTALPFTHFNIKVINESGSWKGYVGSGAFFVPSVETSPDSMELWKQIDVTHNAAPNNSIKLDLTSFPWDDGIESLIDNSKGTALLASTLYYVYLKTTHVYRHIYQTNEVGTGSADNTVIYENVTAAETLFTTTLQTTGVISPASNWNVTNLNRYYMIGVVETGAVTIKTPYIGQLSRDAIYLAPAYRGHQLGSGLSINSNGVIDNTGVLSLADSSTNINLDASTGNITITDGP